MPPLRGMWSEVRELIISMLSLEPARRPDLTEVLGRLPKPGTDTVRGKSAVEAIPKAPAVEGGRPKVIVGRGLSSSDHRDEGSGARVAEPPRMRIIIGRGLRGKGDGTPGDKK